MEFSRQDTRTHTPAPIKRNKEPDRWIELSIQKLTLIKRTILHNHFVPTPKIKGQDDDTHCSAVS